MRKLGLCLVLAAWSAAATGQEIRGLRCQSSQPFAAPAGTVRIPISGGDFEPAGPASAAKAPPGWDVQGGQIITAADAPQGRAYCRIKAGPGGILRTPQGITAQPGRPYFLSMWIRSPGEFWAGVTFTSQERLRSFGGVNLSVPATGNQWRRVGYYFWMPVPCRTIQFHIAPRPDDAPVQPPPGPLPPGQFISVDDIQLRTATAAEMSDAYDAQRAQLPPCDLEPRPSDGQNLALSVAKWEGRAGIPGKPFVIWAIGSSWTASQEDGYGLIEIIRKRFPHAPEIQYKRHDGAGTPWDYAAGWVRQFVAPQQPDLVFTYTVGTPDGLDALLGEVRRDTTADIIVPSIHFIKTSPLTDNDVANGFVSWEKIRQVCRKHGAEFVENRQELAEYLRHYNLKPAALLRDQGHQNQAGCIRVWDNVGRHVARPARFTYRPESRERRLSVTPPTNTATEQVSLSGDWTTAGGSIRSGQSGARLTVYFTGNRIDLLGRQTPEGGTARVFVDGVPGGQAPAFYTTYIEPHLKVYPRAQKGQPGDSAPHAVALGRNVVPQSWTITMTDDEGDYQLTGSVTGPDGAGNAGRPFCSHSGQIAVDPKLWRNGRIEKDGRFLRYGNGMGDTFTFDVYRCSHDTLSFRADQPAPLAEPLVEPLVQNLPNQRHKLEIVAEGDGPVNIDGLYVFQPPEKE